MACGLALLAGTVAMAGAGEGGDVAPFGGAPALGSSRAEDIGGRIVGVASTPSGQGYWQVASDGGIFSFGDARFAGSAGAVRLNRPIVGMG